jgi:hypothetical protein
MITDEQILAKHSPPVRARASVELRLVNKLVESASAAGFTLKVWDEDMAAYYSTPDFRATVFDLDRALVVVFDNADELGSVLLVFGNDGYDLVSDYSLSVEDFLGPVLALAETLGA